MSIEPNSKAESRDDDSTNDDPRTVSIRIRRRITGSRIDKYLRGKFPRMSRNVLQRLIRDGNVTVNGMPTKASYEPAEGDVIDVLVPPPPPTRVVAEDIPLDIIYEDRYLLAINKTTGIICHPAGYGQTGTIANAVAHHAETLSEGTDPFRPGIVHRLDKNTTGVMLIAKSDEAHWRLSLQFERRTIRKTYLAIVEGQVNFDGDTIDKPIGPHPSVKDRYVVPSRDMPRIVTKEAVTEYKVLERFTGFALVRMHPKTGRTHQLRVHMASIGNPMLGDTHYGGHLFSEADITGGGSTDPLINHQCLHAWRIEFSHPIKERPIVVEAPLPSSIQVILDVLREHRSLQPRVDHP